MTATWWRVEGGGGIFRKIPLYARSEKVFRKILHRAPPSTLETTRETLIEGRVVQISTTFDGRPPRECDFRGRGMRGRVSPPARRRLAERLRDREQVVLL
jgi:hypothetical protein